MPLQVAANRLSQRRKPRRNAQQIDRPTQKLPTLGVETGRRGLNSTARCVPRIVIGSAGDKAGPNLFRKDVDPLGAGFCFVTPLIALRTRSQWGHDLARLPGLLLAVWLRRMLEETAFSLGGLSPVCFVTGARLRREP